MMTLWLFVALLHTYFLFERVVVKPEAEVVFGVERIITFYREKILGVGGLLKCGFGEAAIAGFVWGDLVHQAVRGFFSPAMSMFIYLGFSFHIGICLLAWVKILKSI